ncbi:hypothetical protein E8E11_003430 [Didymella keratinophila]|nr:hypothetical protein E8E11_003430 [Didymella keratinophila]
MAPTQAIEITMACADLELEDDNGITALYHALCDPCFKTEKVEILLNAGANANHIDNLGLSLLHQATVSASTRHMELLLSYGADIDAKDSANLCVIDHVIRRRNHGVLAVLLKHSVSANHHWTDKDGTYSEVIFSAARYGDVATMRLLTDAKLTDIVMDDDTFDAYWYWFDTRPPPVYGEGDPPEALGFAFQALLDSITPREVDHALISAGKSQSGRMLVPGAFPLDDSEKPEDDDPEGGSNDSIDADHGSGGTEDDTDAEHVEIRISNDTMQENGSQQVNSHNCRKQARARRFNI